LQKESFPELDKLAGRLHASQMVIEVRGHTDNAGDEKKNLILSEERAKAVVDYLVSKKLTRKDFSIRVQVIPNLSLLIPRRKDDKKIAGLNLSSWCINTTVHNFPDQ